MEIPILSMELLHSCTRSPRNPKPTSLPTASPMQNAQGMKLQITNIPNIW